jgi:hypothetical protein
MSEAGRYWGLIYKERKEENPPVAVLILMG